MEAKENEKFNKILINGYEELLKAKPENPQAHFIHYLLTHVSKDFQETEPELYKFFKQYQATLDSQSKAE